MTQLRYDVTTDDAVLAEFIATRLNSALESDPDAIDALCRVRVPCGEALAEHPSVQTDSGRLLGVVGLLNGLCLTPLRGGFPRIVALLDYDENDDVRVIGFEARTKPQAGEV